MFAAEIRRRRVENLRAVPQWRWHLDEVFVKINGGRHCLWRAVDHEGDETPGPQGGTNLKRAMKRYGRSQAIVTDRRPSYGAAMKDIGTERRQLCGRGLNNRAENSLQAFRRREGAMARFGIQDEP